MARNKKRFKVEGNFVVYRPTSDDLVTAHKRSCKLGVLPNSFTQGLGRMAGYLGEIAVQNYLKRSKYVGDSVYTHDIEYKKRKIGLNQSLVLLLQSLITLRLLIVRSSSCQTTTFIFSPEYVSFMVVWIVGWLPTTKLLKEAEYKQRRDKDTDGFVYKTSGLHIDIGDLNSPTLFQ